ncbi:hypothetical protein RN001_002528 [Aquatica leii]|uniref:Uncharacterized protein n=1 Tax=Aquatica leii TaxID=1421715 RepID=A0AAN7PH25_9COLE|nr:hypothetical protein RN001_002528 [Aquatica leii]
MNVMNTTSSNNDYSQDKPLKKGKILQIERQALTYVIGYISKKVMPKIKDCDTCKSAIFATREEEDHEDNLYTRNKDYLLKGKRCLKYILKNLTELIADQN